MSNVLQDKVLDKATVNLSMITPLTEDVFDILPLKGAIAYDLVSDPEGAIYYANGNEWLRISPEKFIGFPITNPPPPALLPDGGMLIFNSTTSSWTVYSITGDIDVTNTGASTIVALEGGSVGPFSPLSINQVLTWNGTTWTNASPQSTSPSGPAGGALAGTYPNPSLFSTTVIPGSYGAANQVSTLTVNSSGQLTGAFNVPISTLSPSSIGNVHTEQYSNIPAGTLLQILYFQCPDGWTQFKLYIAWSDSLGRGGTYEYSGGVRFFMGQIVAPYLWSGGLGPPNINPTYGFTLQTVFGNTPTYTEVRMLFGQYAMWVNFQQDGAPWSASVQLEYVNAFDSNYNPPSDFPPRGATPPWAPVYPP